MIIKFVIAVLFLRLITLGLYPLTDPTEGRYAEIGRLILQTGDWITPWVEVGVPFWGKPPLSFWSTAVSLQFLGDSAFAARLPHFLMGVLVIWLTWDLLARSVSRRAADLAAAFLTGSVVFFVSAGAVMTDMALALGAALAMRSFWRAMQETGAARRRETYLFFVGLAIGLLAKGPLILVLSLTPIGLWVLYQRRLKEVFTSLPWFSGLLLMVLLSLPWYLLAEMRTPGFIDYFIVGEHWERYLVPGWEGDLYASGRSRPYGTIWMFGLIAALPWTVILPILAWRTRSEPRLEQVTAPRGLVSYLMLWAMLLMLFFTLSSNVLISYVLPALPALAGLGAIWLGGLANVAKVNQSVVTGLVITTACALGFVVYAALGEGEKMSAESVTAACLQEVPEVQQIILHRVTAHSAAFYSAGRAQEIDDIDAVSDSLNRYHAICMVLPPGVVSALPDAMRHGLKEVGVFGKYALLIRR